MTHREFQLHVGLDIDAKRDSEQSSLWYLDFASTGYTADDEVRRLLPEHEHERGHRFATAILRKRYWTAKVYQRKILGELLNTPGIELHFEAAEGQRPRLRGVGADVCFSVSHSDDLFLLGVNWNGLIGVDIEVIKPELVSLDLAREFLHAQEFRIFEQADAAEQISNFYRYWTRKEAYLKAIGVGLAMDPRSVRTDLDRNYVVQDYGKDVWRVFDLGPELNADCSAVVAII